MVAHEIGGAYVTYLGAKRIGVSRDMRVSSPAIMDAFVEGARRQGCDVVDYGMQATDMIYFAVVHDDLDGGVQITASHNPKQYNGIKMVRKGAQPLSGDSGIGEIRDMVVSKTTPPAAPRHGALTQRNILEPYVEKVMSFIDKGRSRTSTSCSTPPTAWAAWSRRSCSTSCRAARRGSPSTPTAPSRTTKPTR
jgi:phosphomannomutase